MEEPAKSSTTCNICNTNDSVYVCPRCNIPYCSLSCYRDKKHLTCSESFYKTQVFDALSSQTGDDSAESRQRMEEILTRFHSSDSQFAEHLDSDDDDDDDDGEEEDDELSTRLAGVKLDDADAVWQRLTASERAEFEKLLKTGGITELLPDFTPWWIVLPKLVQEVHTDNEVSDSKEGNLEGASPAQSQNIPALMKNVPQFKDICRKTASPCLPFNAVNIIGSYVYVVRCFNGEHLDWPSQAAYSAWNLSGTLSNNQNFSNMLDAITSIAVNMTQKENASEEEISTMKSDAKCILSSHSHMQAALSDLHSLFHAALHQRPSTAKGPFSQRFPDGADNLLPRDKIRLTVKKIEFYLSWTLEKEFLVTIQE